MPPPDGGDSWKAIVHDLPAVLSVEVQTLRLIARTVRLEMPMHLRTLAQVPGEVALEVRGAVTLRTVLDALEAKYPTLRGTVREYESGERRPFLRFFAGEEDLSHEAMDSPLPEAVARGEQALLVIGAVAGG